MTSPDAATLAQELRAIFRAMKRRLREQAHVDEWTPAQTAVLARLEQEGTATISALARAEGVRPQSMAPVVAALEAAGMVQGAPDPADGRQTLLSLTDACRAQIHAGRAARQDWLARTLTARLTPAEQQDLIRATALLRRIVEP